MKKLLYIILGIGLIYIILCLFGPSKIKVERDVIIKAEMGTLIKALTDFKFFHDSWSPWTKRDPNMKTTYTGNPGEPGHFFKWESEKDSVGSGSMTFDGIKGDTINATLRFDGMGDSKVYYITTEAEGGVKVIWGMMFDIGFFGRAPMLFMDMDKMVGPDYEEGLKNLKQVMESQKAAAGKSYEIAEVQWEARTYIGRKGLLKFQDMEAFFGENYPKLAKYLTDNKMEMIAAPSAIYFTFDEEKMETECAAVMAVSDASKVKDWEVFSIPASKVLVIDYYGAYDKSAEAHYAMDAYMKEKGLEQSFVIEEYVTDPSTVSDPSQILTKIYYVVK
ncbi:MAG: SRPBCC family protein [Bacteroidia bacterium]